MSPTSDRDDELAEWETTEADFDAMFEEGEPVTLIHGPTGKFQLPPSRVTVTGNRMGGVPAPRLGQAEALLHLSQASLGKS